MKRMEGKWLFFHRCSWNGNLKLSAQQNETETKQFKDIFETVLFQFHFDVRTV